MDNTEMSAECNGNKPKDDSSVEILSEDGTSQGSNCSTSGSDASSMDFQKLSIHSKMATIVHHDGRQFIERRELDDGGLPYSAEFYLGDELWKLNGEDSLLMSHGRYIAKVSVEGTVDLEGVVDFEEAVRMLLKHLKVVKVLLDERMDECNKAKSVLKLILNKLKDGSTGYVGQQQDVMILYSLLKKHGDLRSAIFKHDLTNCPSLSTEIVSAVYHCVTKIVEMIQRNDILGQLNDSSLSLEFISEGIQEAVNTHRAQLAAICPSNLQHLLGKLPDDRILYITTDDMNLFSDLTTLDHSIFEAVLPMIFSKFLEKAREINDEQLVDLQPLSNHFFLYVCKSLQEVAEKLGAHTKTENVIIYSEEHGWTVTNLQEESQTPYIKCLQQQLQMLARLANHFEPGGPFRTSRFPYEFKLFQNMDAIPDSVRIWMCLLDDCMKDLIHTDVDEMQMLSCFFKSYVSSVTSKEFHGETLECLRTTTHEALRSLTGMQSSFHHGQTTSDSVLLKCNDMISRCLDKFPCHHFGKDCEQIQATLRRIICQAMHKKLTLEESTVFAYAFKQLLKDIGELPLEWYVHLPASENRNQLLRGQFIVPVDNHWKDTEHECWRVVDAEGFIEMYHPLHGGDEIPKHYQLKVIQLLLDKLATKLSMNEGNHFSVSMFDTINYFRKFLGYLKEQPEYSHFELFLKKMGESFAHAIEEERSLEDFFNAKTSKNEPETMDPSHTDSMEPEEALDALPDLFKCSISKGLLTNSLKLYTTQFNKYLTDSGRLPREKKIEQIVSNVVFKLQPQLATSWTEEFKRNELPTVLAGLGAVWSLIVSKSGSSSTKLVKPTSLQISYILSVFGDQNLNNDDLYKLLYISTQQGKEIVLGLTAALLALYGHKVLIACYNSNLARRNFTDMSEVFQSFSIQSNISFGSMEDMARERSKEIYQKYSTYIHECLGIETNANNGIESASDDRRSVLLVDDIDILLQNSAFGQVFERFVRPTIPGLARLQEESHCGMGQHITSLIDYSSDPQICKLRSFLARTQSYTIYEGRTFKKKSVRNAYLFHNYHLKDLTNRSKKCDKDNFRLTNNGVMVVRNRDIYNENDQYASCFKYLDLKGSNFQQTVNGYKNYGYFTLGCIPFPYANLLKSYPLVLGFASYPLDGYEEITLHDHYNINHKIAKRNPLPLASTKFDPKTDFLCVESEYERDWMAAITVAINGAIERNCSVLVFFKRDLEMERLQTDFAWHFKQLRVTTIETASNGENFSEDELAVDEVAVLAIEAVDRFGHFAEDREVHVIQTFWSSDSKEQDLIRRQAERSHSSGSYELIVFGKDLSIPEENQKDTISYDLLVTLRGHRDFVEAMERLTHHAENYENIENIVKAL